MLLLVLLVICTLAAYIYIWQKNLYKTWSDLGIVQARAIFPIGSVRLSRHFAYNINGFYMQFKNKTDVIGTYNAIRPALIVVNLDLIKQILVKDFHYFQARGFYHNEKDDPISGNLFLIDGPKWRALRTKLTPTFTSGKMKIMCPIVTDIGKRFKEVMDHKIESGEKDINVREMFARFTTDVIGTCAFGLECNSLKDPNAKFREIGMKVFDQPFTFIFKRLLIISSPELSRSLGLRSFPADVGDFFIKAVNDTIEHRLKNNVKRDDFIDLLMAMRNEEKSNSMADTDMEGLSMNEIAAQCFVFFLAGFETSSTASSFTIYELAQNQPIQDKLRTHIREVLAKHDGQLNYESLKDMTYLEQCLKEGMRKYPPLPILNRRVSTPGYKLPGTDITLKVNTMVSVPIYSIHRDPDIYPEPEKYDPDRFSPEEVEKRHPFAFLPFGEGPRNCIGERFGMMQAKIGLTILLNNYKFSLNPKTKPIKFKPQSFILTPSDEIYFDIEKV